MSISAFGEPVDRNRTKLADPRTKRPNSAIAILGLACWCRWITCPLEAVQRHKRLEIPFILGMAMASLFQSGNGYYWVEWMNACWALHCRLWVQARSRGGRWSWTLTKNLDFHLRIQARSRGGRWYWIRKRAQERSRAGMWSWAQKVGLIFYFICSSTAVLRTLSLCLLRTAVKAAIALYTSCYAMAMSQLP